MMDDIFDTMKESIDKSHEALRSTLSRVRSGRANSSILDGVRVDYYGTRTPLHQLATISTPEPRMIMVKPFDRTIVSEVEKALRSADLGLNPSADAELIRLPIPPLTEDRRKDLIKLVKKNGEETRVGIRNHRRDCNNLLKDAETDGELPKDDVARALKKIQEMTDVAIEEVDRIVAAKEKEIVEI